MKKSFVLFVVIIFVTLSVNAQSYIGFNQDNYAGIQGVTLNPAGIVDSPYRADINLVSASGFGGSDYFGINVSDVINSNSGFSFDNDVEKFPKNNNKFFFNADVLGPSFMFNLNKKSSIALSTRVRAFLNINNISGELYENVSDGFDGASDFTFSMENFNGTIHAWAELGLTYARILKQTKTNLLKGGITLKYLQGAGSAFFNSSMLSGQFDSTAYTLTTQGDLIYGLSQENFDTNDIKYNNLTAGFGADIGFMYQWNGNKTQKFQDSVRKNYTSYKLKIGASITDIGSINYKSGEITNYDMNRSVDATIFDEGDTEQALKDNYNGVTTSVSTKIKLPTAMHLMVDYRIKNKFYTSLSGSFAMVSSTSETANSIINTVTLAPRLETKWLSVYSPLSLRQYGGFAWGFGFRLGPLILGSGSVLTNLLSNTTKTTDVYVGLKVPFYRKKMN